MEAVREMRDLSGEILRVEDQAGRSVEAMDRIVEAIGEIGGFVALIREAVRGNLQTLTENCLEHCRPTGVG